MILIGILIVFMALVLLQRLVYRHLWIRNLTVDLKFSAKTGIEGSSVWLTEVISSRKALPLPWLTVKFQVSRYLSFPDNMHASVTDDYYREDLFSLAMYQRISRTLRVSLKKRGYYSIKSIDLVSSDLLLTRKLVGHAESLSVITVTPRMLTREELEIPYRQLIGQVLVRQALLPDPFEFRSIREYQSFDTMKSVNWLATARTGQLRVNVNEYTASRDVLILLNIEPDGAFYEELLIEEGIRVASSLCEYLVTDGISCGLISNGRDIITGDPIEIQSGQSIQHVQQVQEQLGRLDLTRHPASFASILENKSFDRNQESVLLMISFNCSSKVCLAWTRCMDQGFKGLWIIPRYADRIDRLPEIDDPVFCWEVKRLVD